MPRRTSPGRRGPREPRRADRRRAGPRSPRRRHGPRAGSPTGSWVLGGALELGEPLLEVGPHDLLHRPDLAHEAHDDVLRAGHGPLDMGAVTDGCQREVDPVVRLHRRGEQEVDRDVLRLRLEDLHAALAGLAVAAPGIDGADAGRGAGVGALHRRVDALPRRPRLPLVEVVDESVHALRRSGDRRLAAEVEALVGHGGILSSAAVARAPDARHRTGPSSGAGSGRSAVFSLPGRADDADAPTPRGWAHPLASERGQAGGAMSCCAGSWSWRTIPTGHVMPLGPWLQ